MWRVLRATGLGNTNMYFNKTLLLYAWLLAVSSDAYSEVALVSDTLVVRGVLHNDLEKFRTIIKSNAVQEVRFEDCYGGVLLEALVLNKMIEDRKIKTSFKGYCLSACAVAFMAGSSRSQITRIKGRNVIGFHASRKDPAFPESLATPDANVASLNRIMISTIARQSKGLLDSRSLSRISNSKTNHDGLFFVTDFGIFKAEEQVVHCNGPREDGRDFTKCEPLTAMDLKKSGITTE
jgi:hypothetical protein